MAQHEDQDRITAALYTREPATDDNEYSTTAELVHMRMFCQKNGIIPGMKYTDPPDSMDAFERMISDAMEENPPFQRIMVCDVAKSFGLLPDMDERLTKLAANGIHVIPVELEPDSPAWFMANIRKLFDDYHRKQMSEAIKRGLRRKASMRQTASNKNP